VTALPLLPLKSLDELLWIHPRELDQEISELLINSDLETHYPPQLFVAMVRQATFLPFLYR
jgi:hypothetical protein